MAENPKHGREHQAKVTELTASLPYSANPSASYTQKLDPAHSGIDVQYLFRAQDSTLALLDPHHSRRKQSGRGAERKKHRRTRSGCYTCRARRIKCDETHPICERCRKGGRDCVYPELAINSKEASNCEQGPIQESPSSSSDEYEDNVQGDIQQLQTILDEDKGPGSTVWPARASADSTFRYNEGQVCNPSQTSEVPSLDKGASPTPSTEGSMDDSYRHRFRPKADPRSRPSELEWSHLPTELQSHLTYFYENVNYLHYSLKLDFSHFLKTDFMKAALEYEPLLYAIAGFSSFQRTLQNPKGNIQDFLPYYNKAVSLLLKSLQRRDDRSTGMILAILQLATIEEFLGDWINLLGHQRAAYQILTEVYTPETVLMNNTSRVILGWYMRFDVFAGLMGGFDTVLSRDWFSGMRDFFQHQVRASPSNLEWKMELAISQLRLVAMDMSNLFVRMGKGELTQVSFAEENEDIRRRIESWRTELDEGLQDTQQPSKNSSDHVSVHPQGIVGPYLSGRIYSGLLWPMNISTIDWYAIFLMHKYQTALATQTQPGPELGVKALESCQMYEALEFNSESPPGTVLAMQASHGIASLFLPRDEKYSMWARRKLAAIESQGYIYPLTFRKKMADLFKDQSCLHWWLPNEEAYPPIIRSIRKFVEERTSPAIDVTGEDLRDMKAIFASLQLSDVKDPSRKGH